MKRALAIFIALSCMVIIIGDFTYLAKPYANHAQADIKLIRNHFYPCQAIPHDFGDKRVVLRLDDVRGDLWSDIDMRMITDSLGKGVRPVLGVIPSQVRTDPNLYQFLKNNRCNFEVAQHGLTHEYQGNYDKPEFVDASYDQAYARIKKGKELLADLISGNLITFIPPQNIYSEDTGRAIADLGFDIISGDEGNGVYDLDTATKLYEHTNEVLVAPDEVVAECDLAVKNKKPCVVATHPQDYATKYKYDAEKYKVFLEVLDLLKANGYSFVTFQDLEDHGVSSGTVKSSVKK